MLCRRGLCKRERHICSGTLRSQRRYTFATLVAYLSDTSHRAVDRSSTRKMGMGQKGDDDAENATPLWVRGRAWYPPGVLPGLGESPVGMAHGDGGDASGASAPPWDCAL